MGGIYHRRLGRLGRLRGHRRLGLGPGLRLRTGLGPGLGMPRLTAVVAAMIAAGKAAVIAARAAGLAAVIAAGPAVIAARAAGLTGKRPGIFLFLDDLLKSVVNI